MHSSLSSGSGPESTVLSGFARLGDTQREPALSREPHVAGDRTQGRRPSRSRPRREHTDPSMVPHA